MYKLIFTILAAQSFYCNTNSEQKNPVNKSQPNVSLTDLLRRDTFLVKYSITRSVLFNDSASTYKIDLANGKYISSGDKCYNENQRSLYVRNKNKYLLYSKIKPKIAFYMDTVYVNNFHGEPYLDINLTFRLFNRERSRLIEKKINDSIMNYSLYIGNKIMTMDSICLGYNLMSGNPQYLKHVGKLHTQNSREVDYVDITEYASSITVKDESVFEIEKYLAIDSIRTKIRNKIK